MRQQVVRDSFLLILLVSSVFHLSNDNIVDAWSSCESIRRRSILVKSALWLPFAGLASSFVYSAENATAAAAGNNNNNKNNGIIASFQSTAYGRQEYTNSITASRDTNLSPAEAYDVIRQQVPMALSSPRGGAADNDNNNAHAPRALDLGAGAGLSTQVLYEEKKYKIIDAVDWGSTAWDDSVTAQPDSVHFYAMDDTKFLSEQATGKKYDVIVYNFAVNTDKAVSVAAKHLTENGVLLAPCNDRRDYWYKQTYLLINKNGKLLWKSNPEVGAWSVQFQPDVTSPTCTGIWCGSFNGFFSNSK